MVEWAEEIKEVDCGYYLNIVMANHKGKKYVQLISVADIFEFDRRAIKAKADRENIKKVTLAYYPTAIDPNIKYKENYRKCSFVAVEDLQKLFYSYTPKIWFKHGLDKQEIENFIRRAENAK